MRGNTARRVLTVVAITVAVVGVINFMWNFGETIIDPIPRGQSATGWRHWHDVSVFITHPLAVLAMFYLVRTYLGPTLAASNPRFDVPLFRGSRAAETVTRAERLFALKALFGAGLVIVVGLIAVGVLMMTKHFTVFWLFWIAVPVLGLVRGRRMFRAMRSRV